MKCHKLTVQSKASKHVTYTHDIYLLNTKVNELIFQKIVLCSRINNVLQSFMSSFHRMEYSAMLWEQFMNTESMHAAFKLYLVENSNEVISLYICHQTIWNIIGLCFIQMFLKESKLR